MRSFVSLSTRRPSARPSIRTLVTRTEPIAMMSKVPPPPPKPESGSRLALWLVLGTSIAGATFYFNDKLESLVSDVGAAPAAARISSIQPSPAEVLAEVDMAERRIRVAAAKAQGETPQVDLNAVRKAIVDVLEDEKYDDGSWGPVFVRLAWHAAGTYDKNTKTGGSDGSTMRLLPESSWGANAGLHLARARLEPVKAKFPEISYADLWSYAGTVAIEEMGGPEFGSKWRPGRRDCAGSTSPLPDGLLPDADGRDKTSKPADHLRDIFYRMGFNDREIVALSGAHALGRCHTDRSGFWGPWTNAPTTFSNEYFRLLLEERWTEKKTHKGKPWGGPRQFEDKTGTLMMLPTDLALVQDEKMRKIVEEYAKDEAKFFKDFANAWIKLQELGVKKFEKKWFGIW